MTYRQISFICSFFLISTCQSVMACSMAPGYSMPNRATKAELYSRSDDSFIVKVLEVKRTSPKLKELIAEIDKNNREMYSKSINLRKEINDFKKSNDFSSDLMLLNNQLRTLRKSEKNIYHSFQNLDHTSFSSVNTMIEDITSKRRKLLSVENEVAIIQLKKKLTDLNVKYLQKNISEMKYRSLEDEYNGPIEAEVEIVHVYKGDRAIGEVFTISDKDRLFDNSCGLGGNRDLMSYIYTEAKPNNIAVIFAERNNGFNTDRDFYGVEDLYTIGLYGESSQKDNIDKLMLGYNETKKNVVISSYSRRRNKSRIRNKARVRKEPILNTFSATEGSFDIGKRVFSVSVREKKGRLTKSYGSTTFSDPVKIIALGQDGKLTEIINFKDN